MAGNDPKGTAEAHDYELIGAVNALLDDQQILIDAKSAIDHDHDGVYEPVLGTTIVGDLGASYLFDVSDKVALDGTLTEDCVLGFTGWSVSAGEQLRTLYIRGGDSFDVTWPTVSWEGGLPPALDDFTVVTIGSLDGGATLFGMYGDTRKLETFTINVPAVVNTGFDETTSISGTGIKVSMRCPSGFIVTDVRASLMTASSSGAVTFDINETGTSILSTKLTIDQSELTSTTAATPAVISDSEISDDAVISIDVDGVGTGAKGARVQITGYRAVTPAPPAAPLFVQSKSNSRTSGSGTLTATFTTPPVAGNLLIAMTGRNSGTAPTMVSTGWADLASSPTTDVDDGGGQSMSVWYKIAGSSESSDVSITAASGVVDVAAYEFSGIQANPLDQTVVTDPSGSAASLAWDTTATLSAANSVVIASVHTANDFTSPVAPSGFTLVETGTLRRIITGYKITTVNTALSGLSTTWTTSSGRHGILQVFEGNLG